MATNGLNAFLTEIISTEKIKSILAITKKDLSSFATNCEDILESLLIINLEHLDEGAGQPNELCIIFDDIDISKTQIGLIKNTLAQKILIIKKNGDDDRHQSFLELGFTHDNEISQARIYSYNLKTYNNKRGWNNPEGWANPENFEKFRW
ncbi:MAG: hypothetical protein HOF62_04615 [Gammaproteobacteria bacterium]|jgi:hypothetical protein|nr:hypothetical protein [Gammaproteobacteria bacterium]MDB4043379.1 DUF6231 family protein [Gammaproteobacteria bacterium]